MKNIFYLGSFLLLFLTSPLMAQQTPTKISIKITDEKGKVIEKTYDSQEALQNDPELRALGLDVESRNGRLHLKSKGNHSVTLQQESGHNNSIVIQQGSARSDSLLQEERKRHMQERDSLLSRHKERRAEHMDAAREHRETAKEHRAEMRRQMEERRHSRRAERQLIIIEALSDKKAAELGIKKQRLELEDLQILPRPDEESLELSFRAGSEAPVRIRLYDQEDKLLLDETKDLSDKRLEKSFWIADFGEGTYFLQINQQKKSLGRKIQIR